MENTDNTGRLFGEIELKLLRAKVIKEVEKILEQVSNKDEDFLYPTIDINNPSDRAIAMNPLVKGEFMGHMYEICTNGMHPTAYVSWGFCDMGKDECNELPVHGGCTYTGPKTSGDGTWYGWDYGHGGDFVKPSSGLSEKPPIFRYGKKWTVSEVMQDVIKAILFIEENK